MSYNLKSEEEVKEYLNNLGIEYRFGCYNEKRPEVCHLLADYLEAIKKDFSKAAKVYKSNCDDHNYGKSCLKFGNYSLLGKGGVTQNFGEAYKYFQKGCEQDDKDACFNEGLLLLNIMENVPTDVRKGMALLEKSCNGKNEKACYQLSGMYIVGARDPHNKEGPPVVPKDMKKAFEFALKGCEMQHIYSCANLSRMYKLGEGVDKNEEMSQHYKTIALDLQSQHQETNNTLTFQEGLKD